MTEKRGFGDRLKEELELHNMSVRALHLAVVEATGGWKQARDGSRKPVTRGAGYTTMRDLYGGKGSPPRREIAEAIARVLGIRYEYLVHGIQPRSPTEERIAVPKDPDDDAYRAAIEARVPGYANMPAPIKAAFMGTLGDFWAGAPDSDEHQDPDVFAELAAALWTYPQVVLETWGFKHKLTTRQSVHFITAMFHALSLALPDPGEGDPISQFPGLPIAQYRPAGSADE